MKTFTTAEISKHTGVPIWRVKLYAQSLGIRKGKFNPEDYDRITKTMFLEGKFKVLKIESKMNDVNFKC